MLNRQVGVTTAVVAVTATLTILFAMVMAMPPVSAGHTPLDEITIEPGEVYNTTFSIYPPPSVEGDQVNITLSPSIEGYVTLSKYKFDLTKPRRVLVTVDSEEEVTAHGHIIIEHAIGGGTGNIQITPLDRVKVSINISKETEEWDGQTDKSKDNEKDKNKNKDKSTGSGGVGSIGPVTTPADESDSSEEGIEVTEFKKDGIQYKSYSRKTPEPTPTPAPTDDADTTPEPTYPSSDQSGFTIPDLTNSLLVAIAICIASAYGVFKMRASKARKDGEDTEDTVDEQLYNQQENPEQSKEDNGGVEYEQR